MFKSTNEFSIHIEMIKTATNLSYVDCILKYCNENFIDPEDISSMISKTLKEKIAKELVDSNYFPDKTSFEL